MTVPEVDAAEGAAQVAAGAFLLDVREADEWAAGRAPGAAWIPLRELERRAAELPTDRVVVCICRSGARSGRATEWLIAGGRDAVNLAGGMRAWAAAGLDVVDDTGAPGAVI